VIQAKAHSVRCFIFNTDELVKQAKVVHHNGYSEEERESFKDTIYGNIIKGMKALCACTLQMGLTFSDPNNYILANKINDIDNEILNVLKIWNFQLMEAIKILWTETAIKEAYNHRTEYQFVESMGYYMSQFDSMMDPNYLPSELDVLCSKVKTTGIIETSIHAGKHVIKVVDTGGQRNERKSK
jgi:guanine nucleotide-binding protein G(i) subunit alpha